jgi:hypothetical protein
LLSNVYKEKSQVLDYICNKHSDIVQHVRYDNFKYNGIGCRFCKQEQRKNKPKYESIVDLIRGNLTYWKIASMEECNYKCIVTGERFDEIHHLYSLRNMIEEATNNLGIKFHLDISNYSKEEIDKIIYETVNLHFSKYGLGVCLKKEIHEIYHKAYGYKNNTTEEFYLFLHKYYNGEYDDKFDDKLKSYNSIKRLKL